MSRYSSLHLVPDDPNWQPDSRALAVICEALQIEKVDCLRGYGGPLYFDDDPPVERFALENVAPADAMRMVHENRAPTTVLQVGRCLWGDAVFDRIRALPPDIADDYGPWDVGMTIGPFSLPTLDGETVAAHGTFEVRVSGDGAPAASERFQEVAAETLEIKRICELIQHFAGVKVSVHLTVR